MAENKEQPNGNQPAVNVQQVSTGNDNNSSFDKFLNIMLIIIVLMLVIFFVYFILSTLGVIDYFFSGLFKK